MPFLSTLNEEQRAHVSLFLLVLTCIAFGVVLSSEWSSIKSRYSAFTRAGM